MIRRSTFVAVAALVLSLLTHAFGLEFTFSGLPDHEQELTPTDVVSLSNAFEDLAETVPEPVEPEPAPVPEPPIEKLPEPEPAEMPTSKALVASPNPKATTSPGTGSATEARASTVRTSTPEESPVPKPKGIESSTADDGSTAPMPTIESNQAAQLPRDSRPASTRPVDTASPAQPVEPSASPAQQPDAVDRIAAAQVQALPSLPVTPVPDPDAIPLIPLELAAVDPLIPESTIEAVPEDRDAGAEGAEFGGIEELDASGTGPSAESPSEQDSDGRPPLLMAESPLVAYAREGNLDGWTGREGSSNAGNSNVTNYAGRILVHLNSAPRVRAAGRGRARIVFTINPNGTLARVDVVQSTGTFELDNAAKAQVRSAAPFPPPPGGQSRTLSFVYRSR